MTNFASAHRWTARRARGVALRPRRRPTALRFAPHAFIRVVLVMALPTAALAQEPASPANDAFSSPANVTSGGGPHNGTNVGATKEPDEPDHAGNVGGASVWFSWNVPTAGTWEISTEGSTFDTLLAVYAGDSLESLAEIASNDDAGGGSTTSRVIVDADAGSSFRIAIDGFNGAQGDYRIITTMSGASAPDTTITSAPSSSSSVTATFEFESDVASALFLCSLDGSAPTACASPHRYSDLQPGPHVFEVAAESDGVRDPTPARWEWTVNDGGPLDDCDILGTSMSDTLRGSDTAETICGLGGDDLVIGGGGDDTLRGGPGDDALAGGAGNDEISGDAGNDLADYSASPRRVVARLSDGTVTGDGSDHLVGVEDLAGSPHADTLVGNDAANGLRGLGGRDDLRGGPGSDVLDGGEGDDTLLAGPGNDRVNGGLGVDHLRFVGARGVDVDLVVGRAFGDGNDVLNGVENVSGTPGLDAIRGNGAPNVLNGAAGGDTISGRAGRDVLTGGYGHDRIYGAGDRRLDGGPGSDRCTSRGRSCENRNLGSDWLERVNFYRRTAALPPVMERAAWSSGARAHSRYITCTNRVDQFTHFESPSLPCYSAAGDRAARAGNLIAGSTPFQPDRRAIDGWMTAPFHALGIIDPRLQSTGFGSFSNPAAPVYRWAATLDVLRGRGVEPGSETFPVVWPRDGASVPVRLFDGEYPDPLTACGYSIPSGLPLIVQLAGEPHLAGSSLRTAAGRRLPHCTFDADSYRNPRKAEQDLGRAILEMHDAVLLIPRTPLTAGRRYTATLRLANQTIRWTFGVAGG